ncbi:hypothetical protein [Actinophytocola algeriensis]|uniref:Uncharacterized protein n=1 Tax=Actinophytocola algeriensis TaxID=1768010 RepID=A0A7W7VG30_9PSEU|nr:hypothetical protein [Actinophytocola algeriensis]MBB4909027.1 hypothetical protein [Actinophytocola algeriensis]MBE1474585.1 hypothetical protein [Actinophytocola algeriensis]
MNALDLPPRRPLPRETRERIRRTVETGLADRRSRYRAPLAAAAAVALLAVGVFVGSHLAPVPGDDRSPAATTTTSPDSPDSPVVRGVTMAVPYAQTNEDLDHCADVAAASPRAGEFAPRAEWRPRFTATAPDGVRITAFLGTGGKPAFCEVTTTTATVSDPTAEPIPLALTPTNMSPAAVFAVYLSPTGLLAGYAESVAALEFTAVQGTEVEPISVPAFRNGMFVVNLGEFRIGDSVDVIGRSSQGLSVVSGSLAYSPPHLPPPGVTGPIG